MSEGRVRLRMFSSRLHGVFTRLGVHEILNFTLTPLGLEQYYLSPASSTESRPP